MGLMALLTVKEVASYLQTSKQQVRKMIQSGELTAVPVGSIGSWQLRWKRGWRRTAKEKTGADDYCSAPVDLFLMSAFSSFGKKLAFSRSRMIAFTDLLEPKIRQLGLP